MTKPQDLTSALALLGVDDRYHPVADSAEAMPDVAEGATLQGAAVALAAAVSFFVGGAGDVVAEPSRDGNQLVFADAPDDFGLRVPGGTVERAGSVLIVTIGDDTPCVGIVRSDGLEVITAGGRLGFATLAADASDIVDASAAAELPALGGLLDGLVAPDWLGDPPPLAAHGSVWDAVAWAGAVYQHALPIDAEAAAQAILAGEPNPTLQSARTWVASMSAAAVQQVRTELVAEIHAVSSLLERIGIDHEVLAGEIEGEPAFDDTTRAALLGESAERRDAIHGVLGLLCERGVEPPVSGMLDHLDHLGRVALLGEPDLDAVPTARRHDMAVTAPTAWWGNLA